MKILFIVTQSEFGGAQRFLWNLIGGLEDAKITVAAGPEGDDKNGLLYALEKQGINTRHLKYLRRAVNPLFDFLGLFEIRKLIKKEKPNVLFLCSSKAGALGSLAAYLYSRKLAKNSRPLVLYRIGGWTFNDPCSSLSKALYKFIEKFSAKWKDIIIVNSEHDRKQAVELKIKPKGEILTIYNGLDINKLEFLPKEEARKEIFNFQFSIFNQFSNPNIQLVGTIANLYKTKGLEYLVKAAKILKDKETKFVVIGEGMEREKLENLIKKYKLEKNFFLIGAIPDAYKYLKAFDIFVLPSVKEGFPWTVLEAMAAKVPIIATKVGAISEIMETRKDGLLVESKKPKQLVEAIEKLINNEDLRIELADQAREKVEKEYSLQKMVNGIEKVL